MPAPEVSIILPVFNGGAFLDDALRSVLRQEVTDFEILAVDDGSTDDSPDRLAAWREREPRLRVITTRNGGPAAARNRGLAEARGAVVGFIDADDLWPAGKLALQLARLKAAPELDAVSGFTCWFDRADDEGLAPAAEARRIALFHVHLGALLYRRAALEALGGLDESLRFSEDMDLYMRMRERRVPFVILQQVTLYYRRHLGSMTGGPQTPERLQLFEMLRLSIARRRSGGALADVALFESYLGIANAGDRSPAWPHRPALPGGALNVKIACVTRGGPRPGQVSKSSWSTSVRATRVPHWSPRTFPRRA